MKMVLKCTKKETVQEICKILIRTIDKQKCKENVKQCYMII